MKPVLHFLGQLNEFLSHEFSSMRHRIHSATMPCTCRKLSRKHNRIHSLNMKGGRLFFVIGMTCGMSQNHHPLQGFLTTFLNRGVA